MTARAGGTILPTEQGLNICRPNICTNHPSSLINLPRATGPYPPTLQNLILCASQNPTDSPHSPNKNMTITNTTTSSALSPSPTPTPTLTATYHNSSTSSTLTFTYPLPTTTTPPASSNGGAPPQSLSPLEAKTAYLKKLRELCTQLQRDLNDTLTEMMREKDMDLGEQEEGEEGEEKM